MKIQLFHQTTDGDLYKGLQVCYQNINGVFNNLGIITDIIEQDGTKLYLINSAMGAYAASELKLTQPPIPDYLGIFTYPNAFIYADTTKEEKGDYKEIAIIYFRPLELKIISKLPRYSDAVEVATAEYNKILNNTDTPIEISGCGQTITACLPK